MRLALNIILSAALSQTIKSAGVTPDTWQFWVTTLLVIGLVGVQYIP